MNELGKIIDLDTETRKMYIEYDFEYFLKRSISEIQYNEEDISKIYSSFDTTKAKLDNKIKSGNKKQALLHIDGVIRKMHSGGVLPSTFELDETRERKILDFEGTGECWAYFVFWKKYEKRKIFRLKMWNGIIKIGSILGIFLSVIKLLEFLVKNSE